jgi:hypothetical protein
MGAQPATLQSGLTAAAPSQDHAAPSAVITSPASGTTVPASSTVTVSGSASDTGGEVGGVEVSTDDGLNWRHAQGHTSWTYQFTTPATAGTVLKVRARATDDSLNTGPATDAITLTTTPVSCLAASPCTIFGPGDGGDGTNDNQSIEVGVKFTTAAAGYVTAIRFFKPVEAGTSFSGHLWTAGGASLGTGSTTLPANSTGWQVIPLSSPVQVLPGTTYVASYFSATGDYASTENALSGAPVVRGPLSALASDGAGGTGVYRYGGGVPNQTFNASNYWADVLFQTESPGPDNAAPKITSRSPAAGAANVATSSLVSVGFDESIAPASVTPGSVILTGPSGAVTATTQVAGATLTLTPSAALAPETAYRVTVKGAPDGVKDLAGNALATDDTWTFTTRATPPPRPNPAAGPGGPVLVVPGNGGFGTYLAEILRAEGLNEFTVGGLSDLTAGGLAPYTAVVLGQTTLDAAQVTALTGWVNGGGDLVALRPAGGLTALLGLSGPTGTVPEGYLKVDTGNAPGSGIESATMQFHGTADRYTLTAGADARAVATLYSTATAATGDPALTVRAVGSNGGSATAFTYDLARSIVLTRQGNPDWIGDERDGQGPIRSDDLFYGPKVGDPQPNYVDLSKVAIPQADEQQRLLANVLTEAASDATPLPRFWYLPRGEKAAIVMTADEHGGGDVLARMQDEAAVSPVNCKVDDWDCIRSTAYVYPNDDLTDAQAAQLQAQGFEIALHPDTNCTSLGASAYASTLTDQLARLASAMPSVDPSATARDHCIAWSDYTTVPEELAQQDIHLDTIYYYWPGDWVADRPGMFTGSGFPQRFATTGGTLVDVYQATTQMTDESDQTYPFTASTLMDNALGAKGYYGTFVANLHTDHDGSEARAAQVIAAAQARGVPVISAAQLLAWTDGRNASSFDDLTWNPVTGGLNFRIDVAAGARGLPAMIPMSTATSELATLTGPNGAVTPASRTVKGVEYAVFSAVPGAWTATYEPLSADTTPPTVTDRRPAADATDVATGTDVTATFSEPLAAATVDVATVTLTQGATQVSGTVTYSRATGTATFDPAAALAGNTTYEVHLGAGITDPAGNHLTAVTWTFATGPEAPPVAPAMTDSTTAEFTAGNASGLEATGDGDGALRLAPTRDTYPFSGAALPNGWEALTTPWTQGGTATVAGGHLAVDGTAVFGPAGGYGAVEYVATIGAAPFTNIGLAGDTNFGDPWFTFGVGGTTDQVYARTNAGIAVGLGAGLLDIQHTYRLEWTPSTVHWLVDGVQVHVASIATASPLRPTISDYNAGGPALVVQSADLEHYATSGTFTSRVLDAGQVSSWGAVTLDADTPTGTTLTVGIRTRVNSTDSWGGFVTVAPGDVPAVPDGREAQYQLTFSGGGWATPLVRSVTLNG